MHCSNARWLFVVLLVSTACSSPSSTPDGRERLSTLSAPLASTTAGLKILRTGATNAVSVYALPDSLCALHEPGTSDSSHELQLPTDDEGLATFYVTPQNDGVFTQVLDCNDANGSTGSYSVEMQATTGAPVSTAATPKGVQRPALTGNPMAPTQDQLHAMGYLSRPDPVKSPDQYAIWLKSVTTPATVLSVKPVSLPNVQFAAKTTFNWSGYAVARQDSRQYLNAIAYWYVPNLSAAFLNDQTESDSFWVGVGGYGLPANGMWQGGVQNNVIAFYCGRSCEYGIVTSFPWVEFIAAAPTTNGCCKGQTWGYDPPEGDYIGFEVFFGYSNEAAGITDPAHQYLWYHFEDITAQVVIGWGDEYHPDGKEPQGTIVPLSTELSDWVTETGNPPATPNVTGGSAEWIVERPLISQGYTTLPNFGSAIMYYAEAYDTLNQSWVNFDAQPNVDQIRYD